MKGHEGTPMRLVSGVFLSFGGVSGDILGGRAADCTDGAGWLRFGTLGLRFSGALDAFT